MENPTNSFGWKIWQNEYKEVHREDGPAVISPNGVCEWYLNDIELSKEEWWEMLSHEAKLKVIFNGEGL